MTIFNRVAAGINLNNIPLTSGGRSKLCRSINARYMHPAVIKVSQVIKIKKFLCRIFAGILRKRGQGFGASLVELRPHKQGAKGSSETTNKGFKDPRVQGVE